MEKQLKELKEEIEKLTREVATLKYEKEGMIKEREKDKNEVLMNTQAHEAT